jgi:hypothetical protein
MPKPRTKPSGPRWRSPVKPDSASPCRRSGALNATTALDQEEQRSGRNPLVRMGAMPAVKAAVSRAGYPEAARL